MTGGGGSGGGSGGGTSTSTSQASYPAEFQPLATSAVKEIQALQKKLPLEGFSAYQPGGVAGLSPLQQFAMQSLLPGTLNAPYGMQGLLDLPGSVGPTAMGAMKTGAPTSGAQSALATLAPRLGNGTGMAGGPTLQSADPFYALIASRLPQPSGASPAMTAFPGLTPSTTGTPAIPSSMTVPGIGGPNVDVSQGSSLAPTTSPAATIPPPPMPSAPASAAVPGFTPEQTAAFTKALARDEVSRMFWSLGPWNPATMEQAQFRLVQAGYAPEEATSIANAEADQVRNAAFASSGGGMGGA